MAASKKVYENAVAHVEHGRDPGSYVVVVTDEDREVAHVQPDEFGDELAKARAIDHADLMAHGVPQVGGMAFSDQEAPRPSARQQAAPVAETKPEQ